MLADVQILMHWVYDMQNDNYMSGSQFIMAQLTYTLYKRDEKYGVVDVCQLAFFCLFLI